LFLATSQTDENHDDKNLQSVREVHVRRATIVDDVLNQFRDPTILRCSLAVTFNDETGLDFGGLTQELFSAFWDAVWDKYFEGETAKVPFVPPQSIARSKAAFKAIGRVLAHGWVLTKQIPILFCEASFIAAIHGQDKVTDEILLRSFHFYISQFERDILQHVANGDSKQPRVVEHLHTFWDDLFACSISGSSKGTYDRNGKIGIPVQAYGSFAMDKGRNYGIRYATCFRSAVFGKNPEIV
jgi:hypothetical protein